MTLTRESTKHRFNPVRQAGALLTCALAFSCSQAAVGATNHAHRAGHPRAPSDPSAEPTLRSNSVLVLDEESSAILLSKRADMANPIASITKLMTAVVIMEAGQPMDEPLEITAEDEILDRPFSSRLPRGTQLSRAELLHLALMASENRAAHALARNYPGGLAACIAAMNAKARELGMTHTQYVEPTGLSSHNVSSPEDLSKLVIAASSQSTIQAYSTDSHFAVPVGRHLLEFHTTDRLVSNPGWDIVIQKTGYIVEAGRCLVMKAIIEGRAVVIVLMNSTGTKTRLADAQRIKTWLGARALNLAKKLESRAASPAPTA
jgi:serine-type D-Ala-D-Ala endopeptidase (penicillin-binding protein 7)